MKPRGRSVHVPLWYLMALFGAVYMVMLWLGYMQIERALTRKQNMGQVFNPRLSLDKGFQLYSQKCPNIVRPLHSHVANYSRSYQVILWKPEMCPAGTNPLISDIQMEREWTGINVNYPQYVYTVSGWVQLIDVPSYNIKQLRVFIVPHSHQDLGWRDTIEAYFSSWTRHTLNYLVKFLGENPTWKFIWSEASNLEKWFARAGNASVEMKRLIRNGQLEIATGGWVMTDESVAHYSSMLDQLIEGHLWLQDNLGMVPNTSWSVDPFGHSPTMAYLLKQSGVSKMVIQRTHFAIKRHFAKRKKLEFVWQQAWDSDGTTGILCHMMPFLLYAIHYSCGPDPHVCCQFDFHSDKCFHGTKTVPKLMVDNSNVRKLAWALWEQFQKKSQLYQSNVLLVPHGEDFRYSTSQEWTEQFENMGRLMDYMNTDKDMNIKVQFGTLSDYFSALDEESQKFNMTFPSLSGDFFPYNDRDDQYWTGYYSVRPLYKHMARVLQSKLRITEILFSLVVAQSLKIVREFYGKHFYGLVQARRASALFHHHDAITGTSAKFVMADYGQILQGAINKLDTLLALLMLNSVVKESEKYAELPPDIVALPEEWTTPASPPRLKVSPFEDTWFVTVTNPLTISWRAPITVRTTTRSLVREKGGAFVPSQINPVLHEHQHRDKDVFDIVFVSDVPALSVKVYEMVKDSQSSSFSMVTLYGHEFGVNLFIPEFHATLSREPETSIENHWLKAAFSTCTGTLQYTLRKADHTTYKTEIKMVSYGTGSWINPFKDKSGAYIFMPDGPAQELEYSKPSMVVITGPVMSSVTSILPGGVHTVSLYNISGPLAAGVHISNMVDISSNKWANQELAMRITTDVESLDNSFCVDLNGFQMHRKKWRSKFLIQGNFHPMTSMAYLINEMGSRMSLVTSEAHGVASLTADTLEVMLDRRLMQDDWRGLNEAANDNVASPSKFILIPERSEGSNQVKGLCQPSLLAHLLSSHLNNPPQIIFHADNSRQLKPQASFLTNPWPCSYHLLNIRNRGFVQDEDFQALLLIHKVGLDCNYRETHMDCDNHTSPHLGSLTGVSIRSATETSLTGVREIRQIDDFVISLEDMAIKTVKVTFR